MTSCTWRSSCRTVTRTGMFRRDGGRSSCAVSRHTDTAWRCSVTGSSHIGWTFRSGSARCLATTSSAGASSSGVGQLVAVRADVLYPRLVDDQAEADVARAGLEGDPRESTAYLGRASRGSRRARGTTSSCCQPTPTSCLCRRPVRRRRRRLAWHRADGSPGCRRVTPCLLGPFVPRHQYLPTTLSARVPPCFRKPPCESSPRQE